MSNDIKAIETRYAGRFFRSRKEARMAVFLDALDVPYDYECEGYELPSGRYLPDFYLPTHEYWIEIKGKLATNTELRSCEELCWKTRQNVYLFDGPFFDPEGGRMATDAPASKAFWWDGAGATMDDPYLWCECPQCESLGIAFRGRSDRLVCKECYQCAENRMTGKGRCDKHAAAEQPERCTRMGHKGDGYATARSARLCRAWQAALSARFEHGHQGAA